MPWVLCGIAAFVVVCVANAVWPLRRPWWLKLVSFNLGWLVNELPFHALAGNAVLVTALAASGTLDERPAQLALLLTVMSSLGLVVLAVAHRRAGAAIDAALGSAFPSDSSPALSVGTLPKDGPPPRSWLLAPLLAWFSTPEVERVANVVYSTAEGRDLRLDVFRPAARREGCPVLVQIHGGGWVTGDRRLEARPLIARMAAQGWVVVSIDYRVGRRAKWPDHIIDVNTALVWVREHVAEYGGDPDFVAVTGGSAGGHLAALAALSQGDVEYLPPSGTPAVIRACVPFYGVYDFENSLGLRASAEQRLSADWSVVKAKQTDVPEVFTQATPLARVHEGAPPFLVVQGTSDNLVTTAESRAFADRLRTTSRATVAYAEVPRGQHEFDALPSVRTAHVIAGVERFLTRIHDDHTRSPQHSAAADI